MKRVGFLLGFLALLVLPSLVAAQDSDGDGLPDWWENKYNECMMPDVDDAWDNYDGDAYSNYDEYLNGTDPCFYNGCSDGIDNDGDGFIDWPDDPDCVDSKDPNELKPSLVGEL
jgi:hypothetical protein